MATIDDPSTNETAATTAVVDEVLDVVARTAPEIRDGLPGRRMAVEGENPSGETQMAADVFADELLCDRVGRISEVGTYASEERPEAVDVGEGRYSVCIDPLDGSSNLKPNNTMGTIVAIYDGPVPATGRDIVAAAYVLYGATTTMITAREETGQVKEFVIRDEETYDEVRSDVTLPDDPTVYGFGGRVPDWTEEFTAFVREIESDPDVKLRYGGSMIGDVNQVVTYGGIFAYPTLQSAPESKLRVQFEGYPVGYIVEKAGGYSSDGHGSLLDVEKDDLHARTPLYIGNEEFVERLEEYMAGEA